MLWHVWHYWPSGCWYAFNIYHHWKVLVLRGSILVVLSKEGIIQGNPMAMFLYALGTLLIAEHLKPLQLIGHCNKESSCASMNNYSLAAGTWNFVLSTSAWVSS
eukprot:6365708-Ditylum_brightwellii.AAC.1